MHVLTKIFVVLVALLSVMIVPLVVVYAKNEASYKARYVKAEDARAAAVTALNSANASYGAQIGGLNGTIDTLKTQAANAERSAREKDAEILRLQAELADAKALHAQINSKISIISSTLESGQNLIQHLVDEAGKLRTQALAAERQNAELMAQLRETDRNLEVAEAAVRSLREEVQRLSEARGAALDLVARYEIAFGKLEDSGLAPTVPIDRNVTANVIDVRRSEGLVLAEIYAGQRDGIKEGWVLIIGDGHGGYVGRLHIINVDINRATGIVQDVAGNPVLASVGHRAFARRD
ncbi:MAG: hypothetical protein KJZ68_00530 [Phycisphaerales bacterium]|nr:hypothetical protein [Phycisphaerales bacterium]